MPRITWRFWWGEFFLPFFFDSTFFLSIGFASSIVALHRNAMQLLSSTILLYFVLCQDACWLAGAFISFLQPCPVVLAAPHFFPFFLSPLSHSLTPPSCSSSLLPLADASLLLARRSYESDTLSSVAWFLCALCVRTPFETAGENLAGVLARVLTAHRQKQQQQGKLKAKNGAIEGEGGGEGT
jgi:hypothetical protein